MVAGSRQIGLIYFGMVAAFILAATPAFANAITWFGAVGASPLGYISITTRGLALVGIVLLEAVVLWRLVRITFPTALKMSFAVNLLSSVVGLVFGGFVDPILGALGFVPFAVLVALVIYQWRNLPVWFSVIVLISTLVGLPSMGYADLLHHYTTGPLSGFAMYLSLMVFGFGISIFFEGMLAKKFVQKPELWRGILVANILSYVILAGLMTINRTDPGFSSRRPAWESRAKSTICSVGSSQLGYQNTNNDKLYGSFNALQRDLYIAEGYTLDNMIGSYSMTWEVHNISTVPTERTLIGAMNTFTIIAWPQSRNRAFTEDRAARVYSSKVRALSTFAITEDQTVRVYNPENDNELENVKTWDPIL